ncbi:hypothetical protein [Nocardia sp. NBC_00403]|uniref:hypothetical protein n=1 Tax=Nocardia sp. NBC_00403 TaxID=2975990 RepID=UPI002E1B7253
MPTYRACCDRSATKSAHPSADLVAESVDAGYRELAARLGDDTPASVDEHGELHVAITQLREQNPHMATERRGRPSARDQQLVSDDDDRVAGSTITR